MIFWPERYINVLSQADLLLELLSLRLRSDGYATSEYHIDFLHLILIVGIGSVVLT
jgi:hypothetical protein